MIMRNQKWSEEEVILLIDLYFDLKQSNTAITDAREEIHILSELLRKLAIINGNDINETFRNENGITMKLNNIRYIDTLGNDGLSAYSDLDKNVYDQFVDNSDVMRIRAKSIYKRLALK